MEFRFSSSVAEKFFLSNTRIIVWVSGYNSGKSWTAVQKSTLLQQTFPGYRVSFFRDNATDLKRTTKQTFYKVVPSELIKKDSDGQVPETEFINDSKIYWQHINIHTIDSIKSLEINMAIFDQAEVLDESVFDAIDSRVGRWEDVEIPAELEDKLPKNEFTGKPEPPAYFVLLLNPPPEGDAHWVYQTLEPKGDEIIDSEVGEFYAIKRSKRVTFIESSSVLNKAINKENLDTLLSRDKAFVDRFVHGKRGQGEGAIHYVHDDSIIEFDERLFENLMNRAALYRILDYGSTAPTACTWWACYKGLHFCYREYYQPNQLISYHRREIANLSGSERYIGNFADPAIFKKDQQAKGGRYSIADEFNDHSLYCDRPGDSPHILFQPADNNEFATRNRINELLQISPKNTHPITNQVGAPGIYFFRKSDKWPNGCYHTIRETKSQKKQLLTTINGRPIYGEERDDSVSDHSYDTVRYYISIHSRPGIEPKPRPHEMSFKEVLRRVRARKIYEEEDSVTQEIRVSRGYHAED